MPQMAPMWWLFLYLIFSFSFILISSMIFFLYMKSSSYFMNFSLTKKSPKINWLW